MSLEPVFTLQASILSMCVCTCVKVYACPWQQLKWTTMPLMYPFCPVFFGLVSLPLGVSE